MSRSSYSLALQFFIASKQWPCFANYFQQVNQANQIMRSLATKKKHNKIINKRTILRKGPIEVVG
jgi:hypothetical protein